MYDDKGKKDDSGHESKNLKWSANYTSYSSSVNHTYSITNPYEWALNTCSNANLTPFKDRIQNYRPFTNVGTVDGLGGKRVKALGIGPVTLTDKKGATYTLKDVLYVPEHATPIISLMKARRNGFRFSFVDDIDSGCLLTHPNSGIELFGHSQRYSLRF
jgi:hypothetical protein